MPSPVFLPIHLAKHVELGTADVQMVPATPGLLFLGHFSRMPSGAATYAIRAGTSASGRLLFPRVIGTGNSQTVQSFLTAGVRADEGIFLDRITGESEVGVYYSFIF